MNKNEKAMARLAATNAAMLSRREGVNMVVLLLLVNAA
jgi:hypothetical protein